MRPLGSESPWKNRQGESGGLLSMINQFTGENRFLSNFFKCPIAFEGDTYPTLEHAFQAAKTSDPGERAHIRSNANPLVAKRKGRRVSLRSDWEMIKRGVMLDLLRLKFADPELSCRLLQTGDEELVEGNRWHDCYWGRCECANCRGEGQNVLGKLLMQVRGELRERSAT